MIEETARVVAASADSAQVEIIKTSSCNSCHASGACGTAAVSRFFNFRAPLVNVDNPLNAKQGDQVIVAISDDTMLKGSFLLYLVPLLSLFVFAMAANYIATEFGITAAEPFNIFAGLLGLLVGLVAVNRLSVRILGMSGKATITKILPVAAQQIPISGPG